MPTTNPQYGRELVIRLASSQVTNLVSHGISMSRETRDVTTKDSSDNQEVRPTIKSRQITFEAIRSENAVYGYEDLLTAYENGTAIQWQETAGVSGHQTLLGVGYITQLDKEAPHDGNVMFTGTVTVTGAVTASVTT
jgi:predicted secreted protein